MHKADSRPEQPDNKQWLALFGTLVLIGIAVGWGLING